MFIDILATIEVSSKPPVSNFWSVVANNVLSNFHFNVLALSTPEYPDVPFAPLVPELPEVPEVPELPDVPDDPFPPVAPFGPVAPSTPPKATQLIE